MNLLVIERSCRCYRKMQNERLNNWIQAHSSYGKVGNAGIMQRDQPSRQPLLMHCKRTIVLHMQVSRRKLIIGVQLGQFEGGLSRVMANEFIRSALFLSSVMN